MERKGGLFSDASRGAGDGFSLRTLGHSQWLRGARGGVLAVAILALLCVLVFVATRGVTTTARAPDPTISKPASSSKPAPTPQRPAFSRAEEAYIQALWPIHGEVERSTIRFSLGKIFYKTNDIGTAELKSRADDALSTYRRAEAKISALQPPPSLQGAHDDYLAAISLFQRSVLEALKMFDDGNDSHLLVAYPLSKDGSEKIRAIGAQFWQDEFPPN